MLQVLTTLSITLIDEVKEYTPVGDISAMTLCILMLLLLIQTYIHRDRNFTMLLGMLITAVTAASSNIISHMLMNDPMSHLLPLYGTRLLSHLLLAFLLYMKLSYLYIPFWIPADTKRNYRWISMGLIAAATAADVCGTIFRFNFYADWTGVHAGFDYFFALYIIFILSALYLIIRYRECVIRQVTAGLLSSELLALLILSVQQFFSQESYTSISCLLPIIGIIFIFHPYPFDLSTGTATENRFYRSLEAAHKYDQPLVIISCLVPNFSRVLLESKELRYEYYQFSRQQKFRSVLYRLESGRLVLTFPKTNDDTVSAEGLLEQFKETHEKLNLDYKIIITQTNPDIRKSEDYIRLLEETERVMPLNSVHQIESVDLERFYGNSYILSELEDIATRKKLDDERVLVYCQPVFNINTGTYDTAEALMRLRLPQIGMVFPDQFIPIAEQTGYIHTLSLIILNKTCAAIRSLLESGYDIQRVSVNFSVLDIRYDSFCRDVQQIITYNQIPFHKIAIEITESRSEADFNIMKSKVLELQKLGIKFYLDDFGTGYSNFERIMEIPFDIIKFDRSMTIESAKNETSFYMVSTFAKMFSELHYTILFEGIENDADENNCVRMSAEYLQGYKYSKPIPIEQLSDFLLTTNA